ncbi:DMT family transporter [Candidatus Methylospira mobilis]|uniref:DMT family transporter n=1 Tax=Candidatus Methylospira mobilis TaxID=1808979 RepID=UPI0028E5D146|nr:DMT family transporter [Candidatus Methylospira mobilis]WNV06308.1 DMT family transporter [Candidatus Methylospira mobilis]
MKKTHRRPAARGLVYMLGACFFFSVMSVCVYTSAYCEPGLPVTAISFIRILINLAVLAVPAMLVRQAGALWGDRRPSLWLRGLFGGTAMVLSFAVIQLLGLAESAFLGASSGVIIVALGPWLLRQPNSPLTWFAVIGAFCGIGLIFAPFDLNEESTPGRLIAMSASLLSAMAYLMVARAGTSNTPETVIFYFCIVSAMLHLGWFGYAGLSWPQTGSVWALAILGGFAASVAQSLMTRAYQTAPAALVSAVGYTTPVMNLLWGLALFNQIPGPNALAGCTLILLCGVALPFLTARSRTWSD